MIIFALRKLIFVLAIRANERSTVSLRVRYRLLLISYGLLLIYLQVTKDFDHTLSFILLGHRRKVVLAQHLLDQQVRVILRLCDVLSGVHGLQPLLGFAIIYLLLVGVAGLGVLPAG